MASDIRKNRPSLLSKDIIGNGTHGRVIGDARHSPPINENPPRPPADNQPHLPSSNIPNDADTPRPGEHHDKQPPSLNNEFIVPHSRNVAK